MKTRIVTASLLLIGATLLISCSPGNGGDASVDRTPLSPDTKASGGVPNSIWDAGPTNNPKISNYQKSMTGDWTKNNLAISQDARRNCAPGATPSYHIRYLTRYPENMNGDPTLPYTDVVPPPTSLNGETYRAPMVKDVVVSGEFTWNRTYSATIWQGVDEEWKAEILAEVDRIDAEALPYQDTDPARYMAAIKQMIQVRGQIRSNPVMGTNEDINHSVEVEAPPSHWSFKYNAETRKGDALYRREDTGHLSRLGQVLTDNPAARDKFTQPIRDVNVQSTGTRTILGHVCNMRSIPGWKSSACFIEIDGEPVALSLTLDKAERQAVFIDLDPCIPHGFFNPPSAVNFEDEW